MVWLHGVAAAALPPRRGAQQGPGARASRQRAARPRTPGRRPQVCDVYASVAVVKLDGAGPAGFYDADGVARWLAQRLPRLRCVWL